jgi:nitroimidazol reductase NimA-like FMN-containing flavoprotein (pyridoxamine 5'-phosphate oxidase superfamily)
VVIDDGLEVLGDDEARRLLAGAEVGRVGYSIGALPAIVPVNYRMADGAVVFLTGAGSKLTAALSGSVVAFEVDDFELADRTGWSVLVVGQAQVVTDDDLSRAVASTGLMPFVDGPRSRIVRITPSFVSGRRIVHQFTPRHRSE